MSLNIPVDFTKLTAKNSAPGGYPTQIKAEDLQKNFVYCALDTVDDMVKPGTGPDGYTTRVLKIVPGTENNQLLMWDGLEYVPLSPPPTSGTHVLGAVDGALAWISTEEC
jgi:hypothetical protein